MTRLEALEALAEKLEAGEWDNSASRKAFGIGGSGRAENARLSSILEQAVPLAEKSTAEIDRLWDENARLKEALEKIANYLPMFDYVVNDDYGKPDISKPGSPFDRGRAQEAEHLSSIARAALQNKGGE